MWRESTPLIAVIDFSLPSNIISRLSRIVIWVLFRWLFRGNTSIENSLFYRYSKLIYIINKLRATTEHGSLISITSGLLYLMSTLVLSFQYKDTPAKLISNSNIVKHPMLITYFFCCAIVLKFCTEQGSISTILCGNSQNDWLPEE